MNQQCNWCHWLTSVTDQDVLVFLGKLDLEVSSSSEYSFDSPHTVVIVKLTGQLGRCGEEGRKCGGGEVEVGKWGGRVVG